MQVKNGSIKNANGVQKKQIAKTPRKQKLVENATPKGKATKNQKLQTPLKKATPAKKDDDEEDIENELEDKEVEQNSANGSDDDIEDTEELNKTMAKQANSDEEADSDEEDNPKEEDVDEGVDDEEEEEDVEDTEELNKTMTKQANSDDDEGVHDEEGEEEKEENSTPKADDIESNYDRTVFVRNMKLGTKDEQLRKHFEIAGTIESLKCIKIRGSLIALITFTDSAEAKEAIEKRHQTILNGATIIVYPHKKFQEKQSYAKRDPKRTIVLHNPQKLDAITAEQLTRIFAKAGEIEEIDILCRNVLAIIQFKNPESVSKALELNGTTVRNVELKISQYTESPTSLQIYVTNIKPSVTESELRDVFAPTCNINSIALKTGFAFIKFEDVDSFCKSFLLNETIIQGEEIFIAPYSKHKQAMLKNLKRGLPQNGFGQKKFKFDNRSR